MIGNIELNKGCCACRDVGMLTQVIVTLNMKTSVDRRINKVPWSNNKWEHMPSINSLSKD